MAGTGKGRRLRGGCVAGLLAILAFAPPVAQAAGEGEVRRIPGWHLAKAPSAGVAEVIGGYTHGCLAGAVALPPETPGLQVIRLSRHRNYGHPQLVAYLRDLGRRLEAAGVGPALVGDMAQPRGGPMVSGHASHQSGLDADLWLRLDLPRLAREKREDLKEIIMVDRDTMTVRANVWGEAQRTLVRLAATDSRVARIFVNPAIKAALCQASGGDRSWLRVVRPWYGHDGHLHVRLHCPADSAQCEPQAPLPPGDGCDEVPDWLSRLKGWVMRPRPPGEVRQPLMPAQCQAVLSARAAALPPAPPQGAQPQVAQTRPGGRENRTP